MPGCDRERTGDQGHGLLDLGEAARGDRCDRRGPAGLWARSGYRVCAYMPNIPETVAAFLACASLGAVWSAAAREFGARSVVDPFAQLEPMVLLAIEAIGTGDGISTARKWWSR
jgi:acetoacetyl-CoA synthetase